VATLTTHMPTNLRLRARRPRERTEVTGYREAARQIRASALFDGRDSWFAGPVGRGETSAPQGVPDLELAMLAANGDDRAFEMLAERYRGFMYAVCRSVTRDDQDAVDALQDALLAAWQRIGSFEGRSSVRTWLYRVAANAAVDEVRRRAQRNDQPEAVAGERATPFDLEAVVVAKQTVGWALAKLPPHFRQAVVLRELYGMSYLEMAELLDIPIDTVKSRISRGRRALAELLGPTLRGEYGAVA
jgi:RNA polymerase sigma-70 factor, ECF subfamily